MIGIIENTLRYAAIQYIILFAGIISAYIFMKDKRTMSFGRKMICIVLILFAGIIIVSSLFTVMFSTGSWDAWN